MTSWVLACTMCFGAQETSMIDGAKLIADIELDDEWSELQGSPKTS